jgi:DNA-directed RNA polymerase sigma subunit (sigma70/sigma32)
VRDGDRGDAAKTVEEIDRRLVDEAHTIPQDIAIGRLDKQCALTDRELGRHADAEQARLQALETVAMRPLKLFNRRPALAAWRDKLPRLVTDRATYRRCV